VRAKSPRSRATFALFCLTASAVSFALACGGGHKAPETKPTTVVAQFTAFPDSEALRYAELLAMVDAHRVDEVLIKSALGKTLTTALRVEAARAAGQVRARNVAPVLRTLLIERDTAVAATAAFALGLMADTPSVNLLAQSISAAPVYVPLTRNGGQGGGGMGGGGYGQQPNARVTQSRVPVAVVAAPLAREAAWSLGELGDPGRKAIETALRGGFATSIVLYAAAKLRPVPTTLLTPYITPGNTALLRAAVYAVTRSRAAAGVRVLLLPAAFRARDAETREWVARGLARSAAGDSLGNYAVTVLDSMAHDSVAYVRIAALNSLRGYGAAARAPVVIALRDDDPNVRITAARALDSTLAGAPRGDWVHAYGEDTSFAFHAVVLMAAVRNGVILPELDHDNPDRWQRSGDWRFRAAAAMAGTGASMERIVDLTLPLTRDPDPRVRAAAYDVFAEAAGQSAGGTPHPWRREYMLSAVRDPDIAVRAVGLGGLAEIATAEDVPVVADAYQAAIADTGNEARLEAVRCLVGIWRRDSARVGDDAKAKIAALPVTDDAALLDAARGVTVLAAWRPENGRPAPHPTDWYLRVVHEIVEPSLRGQAPQATVQTARGNITIEFFGADAPLTVDNFLTLAKRGFYKGLNFHRVVPAFVVQDGDPRGDGRGGPGYDIRDELDRRRYVRGTVGMALDGPNTGGSQYFISLGTEPHLDGHYTAFARVTSGDAVLDQITQWDGIDNIVPLVRVVTP
jgi:cyclophilin family peptidyl-prolyl cis-trans isomerase/HEAT repeat protein